MADTHGRPVALGLTTGNVADNDVALPLLETVNPPEGLITNMAYDADRLRR